MGVLSCEPCGNPFSDRLTQCPHCGRPAAAYPNVIDATRPHEREALALRLAEARARAVGRGVEGAVERLEHELDLSRAVRTVRSHEVERLVSTDHAAMATYYRQLQGGFRLPEVSEEGPDWDRLRLCLEGRTMIAALVSQSRGLAVFDDGKRAAALLDAESEPLVLTERELSRLLRGAHDIEALVLPGLPELRVVLHERRLSEQVLHALLLLIDGRSSMSLRTTAGATLSRLAAPDAIVRWLECVLMSVPAPVEADFATAGAVPCDERVTALLHRVQSHQSRIRS